MIRISFHSLPLVIVILLASPCRADLLTEFGTGVDKNNNLLAGGSNDPHFTVSGPGTSNIFIPAVVYSQANIYSGSAGPWLPDDPHSGWIGWVDQANPGQYGTYYYRTTINLTGYNPTTAVLTGQWAADQFGSIMLNGKLTNQSVSDGNWNSNIFTTLTPFTLGSGFVNGINTIDFKVSMPDGGDGLRVRNVQLSVNAVPEPSSLALAGFGAVSGLGYWVLKRRKRTGLR